MVNSDKLLTCEEVQKLIPVSRKTMVSQEEAGNFPARVYVGSRTFWKQSEILAYIEAASSGD